MGMGKLAEIVQTFSKENKQDTAIAIIQNGTRDNENVGIGTINTIEKIVSEKKLANPAIIIIGDVVKERAVLSSIYSEVTRSE
jgi:uroporphyrin-III C-methyltransferase